MMYLPDVTLDPQDDFEQADRHWKRCKKCRNAGMELARQETCAPRAANLCVRGMKASAFMRRRKRRARGTFKTTKVHPWACCAVRDRLFRRYQGRVLRFPSHLAGSRRRWVTVPVFQGCHWRK